MFDDYPDFYEVEGTVSAYPIDTKSNVFHDFMYYMGEKALSAHTSTNDFIEQRSPETRKAIVSAISNYIDEHDNQESVWGIANQKSEEEVKTCKDRLSGDFRTYAYGANTFQGISIHSFASDSKIYPFENKISGKSKVYKLDGEYVKGVCGGVNINRPEDEDICYELKDKKNKTTGTVKGADELSKDCNMTNIIAGFTVDYADIGNVEFFMKIKYGGINSDYMANTLYCSPKKGQKRIVAPLEYYDRGDYNVYLTYRTSNENIDKENTFFKFSTTLRVIEFSKYPPYHTTCNTSFETNLAGLDMLEGGHLLRIIHYTALIDAGSAKEYVMRHALWARMFYDGMLREFNNGCANFFRLNQ
ncbi:MAG: hypothetical protein LBJ88_01705 [Campylobacteraceae bacterium]|jgi:hypothetical protein|nr:hypothetical protein [Campylobacteraceae bacterium]